jgi:hypothetical protein
LVLVLKGENDPSPLRSKEKKPVQMIRQEFPEKPETASM